MADWKEARRDDPALLSEWQVYRLVDIGAVPWAAFQFLVRERLREEGVASSADGSLRAVLSRGERGERCVEARRALVRRSNGGQRLGRRGSERSGWKRCSDGDPAAFERGGGGLRRPRACGASAGRAPSTTSSAAFVEAKKSSRRARPIQSGRATPRARKTVAGFALVDPRGRHRPVQLLERVRLAARCGA